MAIKKPNLYFYLILFLFFNCSNNRKNLNIYNIKTIFDSNKNLSKIYLVLDKIKLDSLYIDSYYGNEKVTKLNDKKWKIIYKIRCGTGCSMKKTIILERFKNKLFINFFINSHYSENQYNKSKFSYITNIKFVNNLQIIEKKYFYNNELNKKIEFPLKYDNIKKIFYNENFKYLNNNCRGIKLDSSEYIFYNKTWYEFDSTINKLYIN